MVKKIILALTFLFSLNLASAILINEFTVDPQTDWDNSGGNATSGDEWVELFNDGSVTIDLSNWTLVLNDSSDETEILSGALSPGAYKIILDPAGTQNNDGQLILYDSSGTLMDSVSYGNWNDTNIEDNAPDGNANDQLDECLARIPNGADTNNDDSDFQKVRCTYGTENGVLPENEQGLNVTIRGAVRFTVTPRQIEFGIVEPGSIGNPALNGPIIFNVTGSGADVLVEITEVSGFPFSTGLKIDGGAAVGSFWTVLRNSPIQTAVPTLDIPLDSPPGNSQGIIVYTVAGSP